MKKRYNVWISIEEVYLDEAGEELDWGNEDIDEAKLFDKVTGAHAEIACNSILRGFKSPFTITIPEEEEDEDDSHSPLRS